MNYNFISIQWLVMIVVYLLILKELSFMNLKKKRFFFIVNGKIYHTNSLVANIISPNISKNYKEKMNNKVFKLTGWDFNLKESYFIFIREMLSKYIP